MEHGFEIVDKSKKLGECIEYGDITDEELDAYAKFSEHEKKIIKEMYAKYPKGFFKNPRCALY